jgi:hypothetical protein
LTIPADRQGFIIFVIVKTQSIELGSATTGIVFILILYRPTSISFSGLALGVEVKSNNAMTSGFPPLEEVNAIGSIGVWLLGRLTRLIPTFRQSTISGMTRLHKKIG